MNPLVTSHHSPPYHTVAWRSRVTVRYCRLAVILSVLASLGFGRLAPKAFAVSPAPDGGYPGFNTAEGQNALSSVTTGVANTGIGWFSLKSDTDGSFNTGVGAGTLVLNIGNQSTGEGVQNTAVGTAALLFNTTGSENTALGASALLNNTTGPFNTAIGDDALFSNTEGDDNTATGSQALFRNTTGAFNTAIGQAALGSNTTGSNNVAVGAAAGLNVTTATNVICIGVGVEGNNVDDSCYIGNIFGATSVNGIAVLVNSNGRLGTTTSSKRFKEAIEPMNHASETLFSLKPVTFRYKKHIDPDSKAQFGLVAEDVEKVNPDLVVRDKEGKPYSVRYDQINAMVLNEFLKEHKALAEEHEKVKKLEETIAGLVTTVKEQGVQIQKVSAQTEMSRSAPQAVAAVNP
jgi:Chaperone of endosialidase